MAVKRFQLLGAPASSAGKFINASYDPTSESFSYYLQWPAYPWMSGRYHAGVVQFGASGGPTYYDVAMTIMLQLDAPPSGQSWPAGQYVLIVSQIGHYKFGGGYPWILYYSLYFAELEPRYLNIQPAKPSAMVTRGPDASIPGPRGAHCGSDFWRPNCQTPKTCPID